MLDSPAPDAIRRRLDEAPMRRVQLRAVALTVLLSALDGYDVLSMTFAAPAISREWGIGKTGLGVALSSGLAGMALGSFLLAPLADAMGRRRMVLVSLVLMTLGSLLCATAGSLGELAAWRVVTGLGVGACVAVINPIAAEFSNARRRPLAVVLMALGYPFGGLVGGLLAAALLRLYGWEAVFLAGFAAGLVLIPVVALFLPESLGFLLTRNHPDGLARLNALLARLEQPTVDAMPRAIAPVRRGYAGVFAPGQRATTLKLSVVNILAAAVVYYVLSWLPQMIADAGFDASQASLASAIASLLGIVGGLILGALARRAGVVRLTVGAIVGLGLAIAAFGILPPSLPILLAGAGLCGFFAFSASSGFYATLASGFGDATRASGAGFVIGLGRVSSAISPLVAGSLFAAGVDRAGVSAAFGVCALVAALVLATHRSREG